MRTGTVLFHGFVVRRGAFAGSFSLVLWLQMMYDLGFEFLCKVFSLPDHSRSYASCQLISLLLPVNTTIKGRSRAKDDEPGCEYEAVHDASAVSSKQQWFRMELCPLFADLQP